MKVNHKSTVQDVGRNRMIMSREDKLERTSNQQLMANNHKRKLESSEDHGELQRKPKVMRRSYPNEKTTTMAECQEDGVENHDDETPWDEDIHRSFVEAIFEIGLKHSSPSVIVENMITHPTNLTSERVKSHLQKMRLHRSKEKKRFLEDFDTFLRQALKGLCVLAS